MRFAKHVLLLRLAQTETESATIKQENVFVKMDFMEQIVLNPTALSVLSTENFVVETETATSKMELVNVLHRILKQLECGMVLLAMLVTSTTPGQKATDANQNAQ